MKPPKRTNTTVKNLPAVRDPERSRPMSSRPPVAVRVDVVVADLKRDPRCK